MLSLSRLDNSAISLITVSVVSLLTIGFSSYSLDAWQPPPPRPGFSSLQGEITELNRGPVHEAFAQPYQMSSAEVYLVDRRPPAPIQEVPSRYVPQSEDYQWISGYWGWEPGEERFVWISGTWRKAPEEMIWYPGFWVNIDQDYAWVSGYWSREDQHLLISRIPPEPRPEDPGRPPSPQHFWVPGQWDWTQAGFQWSPGYWSLGYEGRVWIPSRYLWTPRGYLVVRGFWDFDLEERGVLFSPVIFESGYDRSVSYSPHVVIRTEYLPTHLFVDSDYGHYCFGDYYDTRIARSSFFPWAQGRTGFYDPLRIFFQIHNQDRFDQYLTRHNYYRDHADDRPRHTWREQRGYSERGNSDLGDALLSAGIDTLLSEQSPGRNIRFQDNPQRWNNIVQQNQQFRDREQRREAQFLKLDQRRRDELRKDNRKFEERLRENDKKSEEQFREAQKRREELEREALKKIEESLRNQNEGRGGVFPPFGQSQFHGNGNNRSEQIREAEKRREELEREAQKKRGEQLREQRKKAAERGREGGNRGKDR